MKKIIIASLNPAKINAVKMAFEQTFKNTAMQFEGVSVPSGVSDQPMTDEDTKQGAINRVNNAQQEIPNADFWVGLEGGIDMINEDMIAFAWMSIRDKSGYLSLTRTATFSLPPKIKDLVKGGMELGHADDLVFGKTNSKQANGAVGILTKDRITRDGYYKHALLLALIPFYNEELYNITNS